MSEKEVRKHLDEMWSLVDESGMCRCGGCGYHMDDCEIGIALAQPPDLVALLRILAEAEEEHAKLQDKTSCEWDNGYEYGFYDAAVSFIYQIKRDFGIELTDDEWEWVE